VREREREQDNSAESITMNKEKFRICQIKLRKVSPVSSSRQFPMFPSLTPAVKRTRQAKFKQRAVFPKMQALSPVSKTDK
jgi:hypothetical protein